VIYEEMKLNRPVISPPPLPPRARKNTDCSSIQRSYTTPESDYFVKKKWSLFESVFGKAKKSELKRREKPTASIPPLPKELQLLKAKRNSFSSPDLTHLYCAEANFNNSGCANCSFDLDNPTNISSSNSFELENVFENEELFENEPAETEATGGAINISQKIQPNFQLQLKSNTSCMNLVGSNYYLNTIEDSSPKSQPTMSPPAPDGYLEMRPGRGFDIEKVKELDSQLENEVLYRLKYSFDSPITYKRELDYDRVPAPVIETPVKFIPENHYVCMNQGSKFSPVVPPRNHQKAEHTYVPMTRTSPPDNLLNIQNGLNSRNKRHSVDEKIASYYPNYDVPVRQQNGSSHVRSITADGNELRISEKSDETVKTTRKGKRLNSNSFSSPSSKNNLYNDNNNNNNNNNNGTNNKLEIQEPSVSKKYATLSRLTTPPSASDGFSEKNHHQVPNGSTKSTTTIKKSGSVSPTSIKRFTSLPRFKKIDFSPLRLKISSVLQRNN